MFTIDAHVDLPWVMFKGGPLDLARDNRGKQSMVDFPRMKVGGLDAIFCALYLSDGMQDRSTPEGVIQTIGRQIDYLLNQSGGRIVDSVSKATNVISDGLVPLFLGLEGGRLIQGKLSMLEHYRAVGVRYLTLTHNFDTEWAGSSTGGTGKGLTKFGKEVISGCNANGIIVDVSHTSDITAFDAIKASTHPVIASHSGVRSIVNHPRNLSNDLIKAIAATGGVICIPFARKFVDIVLRHVEYVIKMVGENHVGIGSDLDGAQMLYDHEDVSNWSKIVKSSLRGLGYTQGVIDKVAGGNLMRVIGG